MSKFHENKCLYTVQDFWVNMVRLVLLHKCDNKIYYHSAASNCSCWRVVCIGSAAAGRGAAAAARPTVTATTSPLPSARHGCSRTRTRARTRATCGQTYRWGYTAYRTIDNSPNTLIYSQIFMLLYFNIVIKSYVIYFKIKILYFILFYFYIVINFYVIIFYIL